MFQLKLDERRCVKCDKLLFKGMLSFGFIEVKCMRCGELNLIHSYDTLLGGKEDAYILAYDKTGAILASSQSIKQLLGYTAEQIATMKITAIDENISISGGPVLGLEEWEQLHAAFPSRVLHRTVTGSKVALRARYYPIIAYSGFCTIGVFFIDT